MNREFKGVWIPSSIWLSTELSLQEKCLLVEIDSLSQLGQCFASNEHFSKFLSLSKDRISKLISSLKDKGFIEVKLIYKEGGKAIDKRVISTIGYRQKQLEGIVENDYRGIVENDEDNNTSINNTINNTKKRKCSIVVGSRLPTDWQPPKEYLDFCINERPDLDAGQIALQFKDYWIALSGSRAVKADWFATWRNWVRRQDEGKIKNKSEELSARDKALLSAGIDPKSFIN